DGESPRVERVRPADDFAVRDGADGRADGEVEVARRVRAAPAAVRGEAARRRSPVRLGQVVEREEALRRTRRLSLRLRLWRVGGSALFDGAHKLAPRPAP